MVWKDMFCNKFLALSDEGYALSVSVGLFHSHVLLNFFNSNN